MRQPARARTEVVRDVEAQEPGDAESRVLLDVDELMREKRAPFARAARDLPSAAAREEDVAADDEGLRVKQARREIRKGSEVEPGRGRQSDWRSVAEDFRSVEYEIWPASVSSFHVAAGEAPLRAGRKSQPSIAFRKYAMRSGSLAAIGIAFSTWPVGLMRTQNRAENGPL